MGQRQSIGVPIYLCIIFIDSRVDTKSFILKQAVVFQWERLYKRPNTIGLGIKIAVNLKGSVFGIVNIVHSRSFDAICCQIFAAPRVFYLLAPLTSVAVSASAVKPHCAGVTNLLTGPSLKARIILATSVEAASFPPAVENFLTLFLKIKRRKLA